METFPMIKTVFGDYCLQKRRIYRWYKVFLESCNVVNDKTPVRWTMDYNRRKYNVNKRIFEFRLSFRCSINGIDISNDIDQTSKREGKCIPHITTHITSLFTVKKF